MSIKTNCVVGGIFSFNSCSCTQNCGISLENKASMLLKENSSGSTSNKIPTTHCHHLHPASSRSLICSSFSSVTISCALTALPTQEHIICLRATRTSFEFPLKMQSNKFKAVSAVSVNFRSEKANPFWLHQLHAKCHLCLYSSCHAEHSCCKRFCTAPHT